MYPASLLRSWLKLHRWSVKELRRFYRDGSRDKDMG